MKTYLTYLPELVKEFDFEKNHPLKPSEITVGSKKKVWWIGKCGHSFKSVVNYRTLKNTGCNYLECMRIKRRNTKLLLKVNF